MGLDVQIALPHHAHHLLLHLIGAVDIGLVPFLLCGANALALLIVQVTDADPLPGDAIMKHDRVFENTTQTDNRQAAKKGQHLPPHVGRQAQRAQPFFHLKGRTVVHKEGAENMDVPQLVPLPFQQGGPHHAKSIGQNDGLAVPGGIVQQKLPRAAEREEVARGAFKGTVAADQHQLPVILPEIKVMAALHHVLKQIQSIPKLHRLFLQKRTQNRQVRFPASDLRLQIRQLCCHGRGKDKLGQRGLEIQMIALRSIKTDPMAAFLHGVHERENIQILFQLQANPSCLLV